MVAPNFPPRNSFNAAMRKVYNPLGFRKAYNFILWVVFAGTMFGFSLSRFMYININGVFCKRDATAGKGAAPGECYYYMNFNLYRIGILLHLCGILPAGVLVVLQFTPAIRHRAILFHRINGYLVLLLFFVSLVGALMIARRSFGGGLEIQAGVGVLAILTTASFIISYINIKRLQIEQHRAWMLRGWFYVASIITLRIVMIITAQIITSIGGYHTVWPCAKIAYTLDDPFTIASEYPTCAGYANGTDPAGMSLVKAQLGGSGGTAANAGAVLNISFGMALWIALAMHAVGVEIYLRLTPREAERLRQVSYQRQLEAGFKHPGSAGLTSDRLGDSDGSVPKKRVGEKSIDDRHGSLQEAIETSGPK